ncbi:MAG: hemolysin III family protein [Oscillospiraceae bacterium]|nr:hemolysin III family protein [Oscillospiraceae bacterium]
MPKQKNEKDGSLDPELERVEDLTAAVRDLTAMVQDLAAGVRDLNAQSERKARERRGRESAARPGGREQRGEQGRTPNDALRLYSALTHFIGMGLSIAGLALLVVMAVKVGTAWHVVGFSIYGACMTLLYAASAFYHSLRLPPRGRRALRKLDHTMIYVFIAGVYTPICFMPLRGAWGWSMFGVLWGLAITGIIFKNIWITAPRWLSALSYLLMGWMAVVCILPLVRTMPAGGLLWLSAGGVFYTAGGIFYALKWPGREAKRFGFHEIFHVLVLLGSICHFVMMFRYVMRIGV